MCHISLLCHRERRWCCCCCFSDTPTVKILLTWVRVCKCVCTPRQWKNVMQFMFVVIIYSCTVLRWVCVCVCGALVPPFRYCQPKIETYSTRGFLCKSHFPFGMRFFAFRFSWLSQHLDIEPGQISLFAVLCTLLCIVLVVFFPPIQSFFHLHCAIASLHYFSDWILDGCASFWRKWKAIHCTALREWLANYMATDFICMAGICVPLAICVFAVCQLRTVLGDWLRTHFNESRSPGKCVREMQSTVHPSTFGREKNV